MNPEIERIKQIRTFPSLVKYLREELDWQIEDEDIEDLTFDYEPEELGLDKATAVKVKEIKQLRPMVSNQPWGIFYLSFEPKRLPIVALRRILRSLVIKKRASANQSQMATWNQNDLLFISSYGEDSSRELSFAHFTENKTTGDLPTLKVLGWNADNTVLRLEDTVKTLREKLRWDDDFETDSDKWRERWASAFKLEYRETVRTSKDLAQRLAAIATVIRVRVNEVLAVESEKGELRKLYKAFQEALIHDLDEDDFADMYAQTIAYGLLSARVSRPEGLVADSLADMIPVTNPFLKELMQTFLTVGGRKSKIDFDELGINEVVELLRNANMEEVLKDFGARNPNEDPVIHFYELFLKEYDAKKRMQRGVFYTPKPVVGFIVRSVHEILQKEFGLTDGLADTTTWGEMKARNKDLDIPAGVSDAAPFVQILDPATGTGTFLVEVIDTIYETLQRKWQSEGKSKTEQTEAWNDYVPKNLLPRLYGFELMMAPYSIAHMKIGLKLSETGYRFLSSERAQIYLTNTLEEAKEIQPYFETMSPALAHEAKAANRVKEKTPITVIVGNPPYSGHSENTGDWIMNLLRGKDTVTGEKTENYFEVDGKSLNERNPKYLNDDYVKFIRYSDRRIEKTNFGVLGFITNHGYLDNPTFRGLRQSLMSSFDNIYLVDLHGNSKRKERAPDGSNDENVFDIQQGVSIGILTRNKQSGKSVRHAHLFGLRENSLDKSKGKYEYLLNNNVNSVDFTELQPQSSFYLYIPQNTDVLSEYELGWKVTEMIPINSTGIKTHRDHFVITFEKRALVRHIEDFCNLNISDEEIRNRYEISETDSWKMSDKRKSLSSKVDKKKLFTKILYRPFDKREYFHSEDVVDRPRSEIMEQFIGRKNLGLNISRQVAKEFRHILVSDYPVANNYLDTAGRFGAGNVFPLYLYPTEKEKTFGATERVPNFSDEFIEEFSNKLGLEFVYDGEPGEDARQAADTGQAADTLTPEDIFHYAYAVFHSPTYRARYAEFLKIDFPRLPLTTDRELFRKLGALGKRLVDLHLLDSVDAPDGWKLHQNGAAMFQNTTVASGFPKKELADVDENGKGKVFINKTNYFDDVPQEVFEFHVGGYQVCHKWLKDRKDRELSEEDIQHYGKITVALANAIRLMAEIDELIEAHGGFPLAGSQEKTDD